MKLVIDENTKNALTNAKDDRYKKIQLAHRETRDQVRPLIIESLTKTGFYKQMEIIMEFIHEIIERECPEEKWVCLETDGPLSPESVELIWDLIREVYDTHSFCCYPNELVDTLTNRIINQLLGGD